MIKLDIYSDPICPWCYIGKSYLDRALEKTVDHPFNIEWHPFQLNPDMPIEGMDRKKYLENKFGNRDLAIKAYLPVVEHAKLAGLDLQLDKIAKTPNTLAAHRLIFWAWQEGLQSALISSLFRAYFIKGEDIGKKRVLINLSKDSGLDEALITRLLEGKNDSEYISKLDQSARRMGINSVPTFIVNGQHVVTGAQNVEFWTNLILEINNNLRN